MTGMFVPLRGSQALVAAFRSALVQTELVALLILVALAAAWIVVREARPDLARRAGAGVNGPRAAELPAHRLLRLGFGALWLFDGLLQLQPAMPAGLPAKVIAPAAATSPGWIRHLAGWAAAIWSAHPVQAGAAAVWIQLGIGGWLLAARPGPWSRLAGLVSAGWGLLIWIFGEAAGGLLAPHPTALTGAPGAALLYVLAGTLLALPERHWRSAALGRRLLRGLGLCFVAMAALQAWPGSARPLASMIAAMSATPQPASLARLIGDVAGFAAQHATAFNAGAVLALAAIGIGLLAQRRDQPRAQLRLVVAVTALACLADWVLVQDLGFLGGIGTDPNSMPPFMLLVGCGYLALTRPAPPQTSPAKAPSLRRARVIAAFAGLDARGLLALWAALLVPLAAAPLPR